MAPHLLVITVVGNNRGYKVTFNSDPWLQPCTVDFHDHGLLVDWMGQWRHF